MKYSEIAKKIGLSENGFHYRLRKAMRKVKSYLKDEGIEYLSDLIWIFLLKYDQ